MTFIRTALIMTLLRTTLTTATCDIVQHVKDYPHHYSGQYDNSHVVSDHHHYPYDSTHAGSDHHYPYDSTHTEGAPDIGHPHHDDHYEGSHHGHHEGWVWMWVCVLCVFASVCVCVAWVILCVFVWVWP